MFICKFHKVDVCLILWEATKQLSCYTRTKSWWDFSCSNPCSHLTLVFYIFTTVVAVYWYHIVVFNWHFLMNNYGTHIYRSCGYLFFVKYLFTYFAHLKKSVVFFLLTCRSSLYIMDLSSLLQCTVNIFSHSVVFLFTVTVSFDVIGSFKFWPNPIYQLFYFLDSLLCPTEEIWFLSHEDILLCFMVLYFSGLAFTIRSRIPLSLIFWGRGQSSFPSPQCGYYSVVLAPFP